LYADIVVGNNIFLFRLFDFIDSIGYKLDFRLYNV